MSTDQQNTIAVDQLQVGVYIHLDLGWMDHPFTFNSFKIKDEEQLKTLRGLGVEQVRWDPARSNVKPLPPSAAVKAETPPPPASNEPDLAMERKRERIQQMTAHREKLARVEQAFTGAATVVRSLGKSIFSQPEKTVSDARELVGKVVETLLTAPELAIQVMAERPGSEDLYLHSLNVAVLSMTLAKELGLPAELLQAVGVGALFHDIGLNEVPSTILNNPGPLTKAEREFRELHCHYGTEIGKKAGLPAPVLKIIYQHHECYDGSGYPQKLKGEAIDTLARLVALVNAYDNLCNPVDFSKALTPHEALSAMFSQQRAKHDPRFLQAFIRFMGVYPPGTVVNLSNDAIGLVVRVNSAKPLRPAIILYDPQTPKNEAIILDLMDEPEVNITRAIRPAQLPPAVHDYLSPRRRVSYYFDAGKPTGSH